MSGRPLRLGLVGGSPDRSGWASRAHVPAYRLLPEIELVAVCTAHEGTARAAAIAHGVPKHYASYRQMLEDAEIDAVSVAIRILQHHAVSSAALSAGKHVYCEWPLCVRSSEAQELADLARQRGRRAMTGLQGRFSPSFLRMKELLAEGYLGRLLTFHLAMFGGSSLSVRSSADAFLADRSSGFGALSIAGGHSIDVLRWVVGGIEAVSGRVSTRISEWSFRETSTCVPVTSPDSVAVVASVPGGVVGTIQVSSVAVSGTGFHLELYGSDGMLAARATGMPELSRVTLSGARKGGPEREIAIPDRLCDPALGDPGSVPYNLARLFRGFVRSIQTGTDLSPTFEDGVRLHRILEAVERASDSEGWIAVDG
ncbi:MAG: Gfo/Idh/MocA family oxidoreductase [Chloroflexota bacterium]|nr:Gfo/Idh/MocA family oxidoreductase [Chloroflexota bacterium]